MPKTARRQKKSARVFHNVDEYLAVRFPSDSDHYDWGTLDSNEAVMMMTDFVLKKSSIARTRQGAD